VFTPDVQEFIALAFLPIAVISVAAAAATIAALVLLSIFVSGFLNR
jgi:hypothetical protein